MKIRNIPSFSLAELMIIMIISVIIMISTFPVITKQFSIGQRDVSTLACINTDLPGNSSMNISSAACANNPDSNCCQMVNNCVHDYNNACMTAIYYADNGKDTTQKTYAREVLRESCDRGTDAACQYFVTSCQRKSECDLDGDYDLNYYLTLAADSTNPGKDLIQSYTSKYNSLGYTPITDAVTAACGNVTGSIACDIASSSGSPTTPTATAPSAPSGLTCPRSYTGGHYNIALGWTDNSNDETGFKILSALDAGSYSQVGSNLAVNTVSNTVDLGATPTAGTYNYKISAFNAVGSSDSGICSAIIGPPSAPSGLSGTKSGFGGNYTVALTWADNAIDDTESKVYYSVNAGSYSQLGSNLAANATSYSAVHNNVTIGGMYNYKVVALNSYGTSADSNIYTLSVGAPAAATNLAGTPRRSGSTRYIDLTWTDNATNESNYRIYDRQDGGVAMETVKLDNLAANTASATLSYSGVNGTTRIVRVEAYNSDGGALSSVIYVTLP